MVATPLRRTRCSRGSRDARNYYHYYYYFIRIYARAHEEHTRDGCRT